MSYSETLTTIQQGIFFDQISVPNTPYYNVGGIAKIKGGLDEDRFAKSINYLPSVFDILTADFCLNESEPQQKFGKYNSLPLKVINLEHEIQSELVAQTLIKESLNTPFVIGKERLVQVNLYKLSENEYWWESKFQI